MRNPLNEQTSRRRKPIEQFTCVPQVPRGKATQISMHEDLRRFWCAILSFAFNKRGPHVNLIARSRESICDYVSVVANAACLWRIFAGDDVKFSHCSVFNPHGSHWSQGWLFFFDHLQCDAVCQVRAFRIDALGEFDDLCPGASYCMSVLAERIFLTQQRCFQSRELSFLRIRTYLAKTSIESAVPPVVALKKTQAKRISNDYGSCDISLETLSNCLLYRLTNDDATSQPDSALLLYMTRRCVMALLCSHAWQCERSPSTPTKDREYPLICASR